MNTVIIQYYGITLFMSNLIIISQRTVSHSEQ